MSRKEDQSDFFATTSSGQDLTGFYFPLSKGSLRELAESYRRLRETHPKLSPPTEPASRSAWEKAIDEWERAGFVTPEEAALYRAHARAVPD